MFHWLDRFGLLYADVYTKRGQWLMKQKDPIFGSELKKLIQKGQVKIRERVTQVEGSNVIFKDKQKGNYNTIIWATGYTPAYHFVNVDGIISQNAKPMQKRGISTRKGLYFLGLPFQTSRGSTLICGVGRDAEFLLSSILMNR